MTDAQTLAERWGALPASERRASLDAYHHFSDRKWVAYECSDCHPDTWDEEDGEPKPDAPCTVITTREIGAPDHCPRCGSYLSMGSDTPTRVAITTLLHGEEA